MLTRQQGFTFVEMALVCLIIGILIGATYKGHEMIMESRTKQTVKDLVGITTAVHMYVDRYRAIPGDDRDGARWAGSVSGNGNSRVDGLYSATPSSPPTSNEESNLFWWHLRQSNFLNGATTAQEGSLQPMSVVNGRLGVQEANGALGLNGLIVCTDVPDKMAIGIDNILDDGNPTTGFVRAMVGTFGTALSATPVASYVQNGDTYIVCVSSRIR